ncbi:MAG: hypothetical protein L6435_15205 [Anaerolineae bacterium]|nr:hypothetical protein [Anaerolineae bacterium]
MAQQETTKETVLEQIEAARRKGLLRLCHEAEQKEHYNEAIDSYRQIIDQYHGTPEEEEARAKMLDLAYLFESKGEAYRAKHLYWLLEQLYTPQRYKDVKEARRARVEEILEKIHAEERAEEERRARLEEAEA